MSTASRFLTADHPTLKEIRDLYEGRGLGEADLPRMSGAAIAAAFDVHPHSIDTWVKRWAWRRPAWYRVARPWQVKRSERSQDQLRAELLGLVRAAAGQPCPSNVVLSRALRISSGTIVVQLRQAVAAGDLLSETRGPYRRLTLRDGTRTEWTAKINGRETAVVLGIPGNGGERRSREFKTAGALVLRLLRRAAEWSQACPGNLVMADAAGCTKATVGRLLRKLQAENKFTIERRTLPGQRPDRRVRFADGPVTDWTAGADARGGIDYAVQDAERALRRQGLVVFDVAVHTGRGWGIAWSIDGKVVGRAELVAIAAQRTAKAMADLQERAAEGVGAPA